MKKIYKDDHPLWINDLSEIEIDSGDDVSIDDLDFVDYDLQESYELRKLNRIDDGDPYLLCQKQHKN